ncbi:MAG: F0F1 ATP synthase subunit A [Lentisphaeria bacterium]|nr:F0F1 ATP synthase subunit A [Lentisphaeria bacterium]NQZ66636.1 F0F1 ATP synthase subunit A [Lentisphaeria bacterium]
MSADKAAGGTDKMALVRDWVTHHVQDSNEWHPLPGVAIHLPDWLTLHGLMFIIASAIVILLFCVISKKNSRVPTGLTNMLEAMVVFVRDDIAIPNIGEKDGMRLTPLLCTFFFLILTMNLMGLVPIFATATSNIGITLGLATITLAVMSIGAIVVNGPIGFFKAFIPHGLPIAIVPFIFFIEFLGMFIKAFALTIRLFANMFAGHIIIFAFLGMFVVFGVVGAPAIALAVGIYLLEILVAFLQAYIFTLLTAMFIGQVWHPAH